MFTLPHNSLGSCWLQTDFRIPPKNRPGFQVANPRFHHPSGLCLSCLDLRPASARFHAGALAAWIQRSLGQWAWSKLSWISSLDPNQFMIKQWFQQKPGCVYIAKGVIIYHRSHLLREPETETAIDIVFKSLHHQRYFCCNRRHTKSSEQYTSSTPSLEECAKQTWRQIPRLSMYSCCHFREYFFFFYQPPIFQTGRSTHSTFWHLNMCIFMYTHIYIYIYYMYIYECIVLFHRPIHFNCVLFFPCWSTMSATPFHFFTTHLLCMFPFVSPPKKIMPLFSPLKENCSLFLIACCQNSPHQPPNTWLV